MGINFDVTAFQQVGKQRYTTKKIETLAIQSPTLGVMPKNTKGGGLAWYGAIRNATPSSRSAVAATAFTTGSASAYQRWTCSWVNDYASANITGPALAQADGTENSMVKVATDEIDGAFESLGISAGAALFSNGGGAIGQIASGQTTATITLVNTSLILNFYVGQILQTSIDDGTGGNGVKSGTVTVTGVNTATGTITASAAWNAGIGTVAANDYIFQQGDYNAKLIGLAGWLPATSPGSTLFNGVNRQNDPERLGGCRFNGAGAPKAESLIQLAALISRFRGRPDVIVVNPLDYADIAKERDTKVFYDKAAFNNPEIVFRGFELAMPSGTATVLPDPFCPQGTGYMIQTDTWELVSLGELMKFVEGDKVGDWLRISGDDVYQARVVYRATTYCSAPGRNGVVTF